MLTYTKLDPLSDTPVLVIIEKNNFTINTKSQDYLNTFKYAPIKLMQYFISYINLDVNSKDTMYNKNVYYKDADNKYVTLPITKSCNNIVKTNNSLFYGYNCTYKDNYQYSQDGQILEGLYSLGNLVR